MANSPGDILKKYGQAIVDALRQSLQDNKKVSQAGLLQQSISFNVRVFATDLVLEIEMNDYWKFVDEGVNGTQNSYGSAYSFKKKNLKEGVMLSHIRDRARVHQPAVQQIQREYKKKDKSGKEVIVKRKKLLSADKARKQLAYVLGRSVAKKGIKPSFFIEEALEGNVFADLQKELSEALKRDILLNFDKVKSVTIK